MLNYNKFILDLLKRAKINSEYRVIFTDNESMDIFLTAFTHPTVNPIKNYQELEFIGDGIIKGILSQYIPRRFPNISNTKNTGEGVLSKTRRFLEQKKTLSDFALKLGFWPYVKADEEISTKHRRDTLEDVYEAFIGALVEVIDKKTKRGLGYLYAYNFVEANLDEIDIDITKETLDDPITRLNELYKKNKTGTDKLPLKWGDSIFETIKLHLQNVVHLPSVGSENQMVFVTKEKMGYIYMNGNWINIKNAKIDNNVLYTHPKNDDSQYLWYVRVYGFFDKDGIITAREDSLGNIISLVSYPSKEEVIKNPSKYKAIIIGNGVDFTLKESKKLAANKALEYLKMYGY